MKILSLFLIAIFAAIVIAFVSAGQQTYNYQLSEAFNALKYAKISYCDSGDIQSWDCPACSLHPNFQVYNVYVNSSIESQAFSGYDSTRNEVVVAFRGSDNIPNWINDLDFTKVDYPYCNGCQVHQGFYQEWQSYEGSIVSDVQSLLQQNDGASLGVYGHSLGAAVAVHAAATFNRLSLAPTINEYSFGTPRTGNTAWSNWVSLIAKSTYGHTQRIVNSRDPVPHLPSLLQGDWLHSIHETWYPQGGYSPQQNCNDYPGHEDPDCSDSIIIPVVSDHLNYLGCATECTNVCSEGVLAPKKHVEVSPKLRDKMNKLFRQKAVHKSNANNKK